MAQSYKISILNNVLTNPSTASTLLFDISTYESDGTTIIESYSEYLILEAK